MYIEMTHVPTEPASLIMFLICFKWQPSVILGTGFYRLGALYRQHC